MCKRVTKGRTEPLVCTGFIVIRQALCQSPSLSGILLWVRNQLRKEIDHMAVNLMNLYFNKRGRLMLKQRFFLSAKRPRAKVSYASSPAHRAQKKRGVIKNACWGAGEEEGRFWLKRHQAKSQHIWPISIH